MDGVERTARGSTTGSQNQKRVLEEGRRLAATLAGPTFGRAMTKKSIHQEPSMLIDTAIEAEEARTGDLYANG
jgi:hypothetical protein